MRNRGRSSDIFLSSGRKAALNFLGRRKSGTSEFTKGEMNPATGEVTSRGQSGGEVGAASWWNGGYRVPNPPVERKEEED